MDAVLTNDLDRAALSLTREYYPRFAKFDLSWDDVLQEARVVALEALQDFDPGRGIPFFGYAYKRMSWGLHNALRATWRRLAPRDAEGERVLVSRVGVTAEDLSVVSAPTGDVTAETAIERAVRPDDFADDRLRAAWWMLPEKERETLFLVFCEGLTPSQAAGRLGISKKSEYNYRTRALAALREALDVAVR